MYVQKPNCDHKEIIVSNPDGYDLAIQAVIESTNDPKHLIVALKNPNLTNGTFDCVVSKLKKMATQGYARDAVVSEVLTAALEIQCLTEEDLKGIEDSLSTIAQGGYISYSVVANISVIIEAKKTCLNSIGR